MQINKLVVENFRGFKHREFDLHSSLSLAIGANGSGKSSLLHALQVATGAFFLGLPFVYRRHIHENEIRSQIHPDSTYLEFFTPTIVKATGFINGSGIFTWKREIPEYGKSTSSKKSDVGQIKSIAEDYVRKLHSPDRQSLPVIAFFGVRQMGSKVIRRKQRRANKNLIKDGYYNALGQKSDDASYIEWLVNYEENLEAGREISGTREAMFGAIEKAIPYLKNVSFHRYYFQIQADVTYDGHPTRRMLFSQMSDGLQRMLGIVADIAYRCVILNGYLKGEAVRQSRGIVMIDELDMHLHPNWQKQVVRDLIAAFPGIQFVATTHSPFITQSVTREQIISLDDLEYTSDPTNLGVEDVAELYMGVENVGRSNDFREREKVASEYYTLIREGIAEKNKSRLDELRHQLNQLEERFSENAAFVGMLRAERKAYNL